MFSIGNNNMASAFAKAYKSNFLADHTLVLIDECTEEQSHGGDSNAESTGTPVHGVLLMAKSEYFQLKLQNPLGSQQPSASDTTILKRLEVKVGGSCIQLLRLLYPRHAFA